jgi:hypothetical protein
MSCFGFRVRVSGFVLQFLIIDAPSLDPDVALENPLFVMGNHLSGSNSFVFRISCTKLSCFVFRVSGSGVQTEWSMTRALVKTQSQAQASDSMFRVPALSFLVFRVLGFRFSYFVFRVFRVLYFVLRG